MFGEFFCSILNQNYNFYGAENFKELYAFQNTNNRWSFPEYLAPISFHTKTMPYSKPWNITDQQKQQLQNLYGDKDIIIPTHWYQQDLPAINMPVNGIRLYCSNDRVLLLSYILFWIKSHLYANNPWPSRAQELQELIDDNHQYSNQFRELLKPGQYHNWKFLSYRYGTLLDGRADLEYYIEQKWKWYKKINKIFSHSWYNLDIGNILHGDQSNLDKFEKYYSVHLNSTAIRQYAVDNIALIETELGITIEELYTYWQSKLLRYVKEKI